MLRQLSQLKSNRKTEVSFRNEKFNKATKLHRISLTINSKSGSWLLFSMSCTTSKVFFPYKQKIWKHMHETWKIQHWKMRYFFSRFICDINHHQCVAQIEYLPHEMNYCEFFEKIRLLNEIAIESVDRQYGKDKYGCLVEHHLKKSIISGWLRLIYYWESIWTQSQIYLARGRNRTEFGPH